MSVPRRPSRIETPMPGSGVHPIRSTSEGAHVEVRELLGKGGMSEVFLAIARGPIGFQRRVALKRLRAEHAVLGLSSTRALAREARLLTLVRHPAIVELLDFRYVDGRPSLVLELVEGPSLGALVRALRAKGSRLRDGAALFAMHRLLDGLAALHGHVDTRTRMLAPIVHGDVSPANLLVPIDGYAKIIDLGLALEVGASRDTPTGSVKGTPRYMAPEHAAAGVVSPASDVFAACVIARELLTGIVEPRGGYAWLAKGRASVGTMRPDLPRRLASALEDGLEPDPARRRITARELDDVIASTFDLDDGRAALIAEVARFSPKIRLDASDSTTRVVSSPHGS